MRDTWRTRLVPLVAAALAALVTLTATAAGAAAHTKASHKKAPANDTFSGQITGGTGKFASTSGRVKIYLHAGPGGKSRHLGLVLEGLRCRKRKHCVDLKGKLRGMLTEQSGGIPDTGQSFTISTSGVAKPLGHVSASGTVRGTGFIMRATEHLQLTLASSRGSVTITAQSGQVPGNTSP